MRMSGRESSAGAPSGAWCCAKMTPGSNRDHRHDGEKMGNHILVVHINATDEKAAIGAISMLPLEGGRDAFIEHVETLESYCGTCEDRCTTRNCENKSR